MFHSNSWHLVYILYFFSLDPPEWVPDEACNSCIACKAPFTVIRRKHHCRSCGKVQYHTHQPWHSETTVYHFTPALVNLNLDMWRIEHVYKPCSVCCRSSAPAALHTQPRYPVMARWSPWECALTATCFTSHLFTVTGLVFDCSPASHHHHTST